MQIFREGDPAYGEYWDNPCWARALEIATEHFGARPTSDTEWAYTMGVYKHICMILPRVGKGGKRLGWKEREGGPKDKKSIRKGARARTRPKRTRKKKARKSPAPMEYIQLGFTEKVESTPYNRNLQKAFEEYYQRNRYPGSHYPTSYEARYNNDINPKQLGSRYIRRLKKYTDPEQREFFKLKVLEFHSDPSPDYSQVGTEIPFEAAEEATDRAFFPEKYEGLDRFGYQMRLDLV